MNQNNYNDLQAYCMFLGYPRSGHSLVGALLNAHQDIVMAHELDALSLVQQGISKHDLYQKILNADQAFVQSGVQWQEYNYKVENQWQGKYKKLKVIGDKKGGRTALLMQNFPALFPRLESLVKLPVKIVHVVRNPFDNIATMSGKNNLTLQKSIEMHLGRCRFIEQFRKSYTDSNFITVHHENIIENPQQQLKKLCQFLGVDADDEYLNECAGIVFKGPSRTRTSVQWTDELVAQVKAGIDDISFLNNYTMDD